jgi:hypothetical protein
MHVRTQQPRPIVMPRCCPAHRDWATLAEHLLHHFADVPASAIIRELRLARDAVELFDLEIVDALDCAELIVRQRVISATGGHGVLVVRRGAARRLRPGRVVKSTRAGSTRHIECERATAGVGAEPPLGSDCRGRRPGRPRRA